MTRVSAVPDPDKAAGKKNGTFDAVVLVGHDLAAVDLPPLRDALAGAAAIDRGFAARAALWPAPVAAGGRLVTAPTGPLLRDHDDVRRYADAAGKGVCLARDAGARSILLCVQAPPADARHAQAAPVAALGALWALWAPLELHEARAQRSRGKAAKEPVEPVELLGVALLGGEGAFTKNDAARVAALDDGIRLARDLCGGDPERMAAAAFAAHVQQAFSGTGVEVEVVTAAATLQKDYPLLSAVARASLAVPRHRPCVVRLEYTGKGKVARTLLFAGKGVTYDTGGADLKVGGHMAGMCRDKGGAAAVAGLFLAAARQGLPGVRLVAELGMVRNSIGPDSYVADEVIRSHGGALVRIGNTDAEGRMVLADCLAHAVAEGAERLVDLATLTGAVIVALGSVNAGLMGDDDGWCEEVEQAARTAGEPAWRLPLSQEYADMIKGRYGDIVNSTAKREAMSITAGEFLHRFTGDVPWVHLDIAGVSWDRGKPYAAKGGSGWGVRTLVELARRAGRS
jgi:leucyl aminopeptidase